MNDYEQMHLLRLAIVKRITGEPLEILENRFHCTRLCMTKDVEFGSVMKKCFLVAK